MKNFKNYTIKINTDQSKSYFHADEALEDNGFEYFGRFENFNPISGTLIKDIWERKEDGKLFSFAGMDHYNTTIYYIKMREFIGEKHLIDQSYIRG